jgi:hypothetical protein
MWILVAYPDIAAVTVPRPGPGSSDRGYRMIVVTVGNSYPR